MNITILNVSVNTVPTAKGSYQVADIAFKNNTYGGKVEGKKIMSFGAGKAAFEVLSVAQPGSTFEITTNKNDKGYIDWVSVQAAAQAGGNAVPVSGVAPKPAGSVGAAAPRGNFETAEERAQRQVFIVRQSSIASAVSTLSAGSKAALKKEDVVATAKFYEDYVFGKNQGGSTGFDDVPDFPPGLFDQPTVE